MTALFDELVGYRRAVLAKESKPLPQDTHKKENSEMTTLQKASEDVLSAVLAPLARDVDRAAKAFKKSHDVADHVRLDSARKKLTTAKMVIAENARQSNPNLHRTFIPGSFQILVNSRALPDDASLTGVTGGRMVSR